MQVVLSSVERGVQYDTFCSILCQELQKLPVCECSFEGDNKQSLMLGLSTSLQRAALCPLLNCCGVSVDCHSGKVVSGAHALEAILETAFQEKGAVTKVSWPCSVNVLQQSKSAAVPEFGWSLFNRARPGSQVLHSSGACGAGREGN